MSIHEIDSCLVTFVRFSFTYKIIVRVCIANFDKFQTSLDQERYVRYLIGEV
jgi:hypothetical protein